ncbi:response regulator transcription factor [Singulisphaera acidiphila]|uniref:Response regulator with CheY-like receiver domain and winged-helix DNA-binding domain n=1 Tax=Singulisphaera acidiphila (strain ATCC BAA-1392 / DSM 18658 / VKM B-2454 / MOB10) TaxID=886293 RepID=L0DB38_SINAD|nr:response regulator transcription factor [Singulisphaera acidiphila]AGA26447.1 response regulator with CheY-like receiver domain and winged-helix DNA-binding domain [Singulisphaera acidiphila DSM 18658]
MSIRVLIIEDETNISDFLVRGLREEGFLVDHAADGLSAWQALRNGTWDLVLLDWWLPGQDGLTLLQRFRQHDRTTPVLFLTARDQVEQRVLGLDSGADDYLCKPFDYEELLARIRALIRRRETGGGTVVSWGDLTVNLATQRAERDGHPLDLTAREQSLLVYFLRHPGQVLSRTRLYEHVWDDRHDGISKTLEVHVMELRRKLEAHGPRVIHTLRGRGYVLDHTPQSLPGAKS